MVGEVEITGLKELKKQLKQVDKDAPKELRKAANQAADLVAGEAKTRVPHRRGAARKTIKAASTQTAARVAGGSKKVPYYGWLDFGGTIRPYPNQRIKRPYRRKGRYIWSAYSDNYDAVYEQLQTAITEVAKSAGFEPGSDDG